MKVERYTDKHGKAWVRIKYFDKGRTEVIMPEEEFERTYGKVKDFMV